MKRLIIVGSPRVEGRSGALADLLFESCIEECPEDEVFLAPVSTLEVAGCNACDWCKCGSAVLPNGGDADVAATCGSASRGEAGGLRTEVRGASVFPTGCTTTGALTDSPNSLSGGDPNDANRRCVIRDDMDDIYPLLEDADELIVVAPVYFAGPSSQLKAVLDRFQPYFWTRQRARRRPCTLHVVGEGGDPHGFDPLVGTVRSAAAVAGFRLERVLDWVGKIDESGEIVAEADEYPISGPVVRAFAGGASAAAVEPVEAPAEQPAAPAESAPEAFAENDFAAQLASQAARRQQRARLDLGENGSERQVIKLDEEGRRVDAAQHGRKRSAQKKHANAKRGTNGVQQAKHDNPHAQKGKGGGKAGGAKGGNANSGGKQRKRRG